MRHDVVEYAKTLIGSRYQWGAEGPYNVGFDCSGFVLECLRSVGWWGMTDASSQAIYETFKQKPLTTEEPRPDKGDLVFFGKDVKHITHIGIAINNYQYIEAGGGDSKTVDKGMIRIRPMSWRKDRVAALNIFGKEI
jgi:cell wall-associated NlpC family hydrolase